MGRGDFRGVHVRERDEKSVRKPEEKPTEVENPFRRGSDLDCACDGVDDTSEPESLFTTKKGGEHACDKGGDERTECEEGSDELLDGALS